MTELIEKDKILREAYRHYNHFKEYVKDTGKDTITYRGLTLSFFDLDKNINKLSPRKREAFYLNVILDMKQKDVAKIMGITCVSVGQYTKSSVSDLAKLYFEGETLT